MDHILWQHFREETDFLELPVKEAEIAERMEWIDEHEDELSFRLGGWKWIPVYEVGDRAYMYIR